MENHLFLRWVPLCAEKESNIIGYLEFGDVIFTQWIWNLFWRLAVWRTHCWIRLSRRALNLELFHWIQGCRTPPKIIKGAFGNTPKFFPAGELFLVLTHISVFGSWAIVVTLKWCRTVILWNYVEHKIETNVWTRMLELLRCNACYFLRTRQVATFWSTKMEV